MTILICRHIYEAMLTHLHTVYPEEGCGFLGMVDGVYCRHFPIENTLHSPTTYQMHPQQQVKAMLQMGDEFAIYHSHPHSPAYPSPTDIHQATYPHNPYFIVSLAQKEQPILGAFSIQDGVVNPHSITLV